MTNLTRTIEALKLYRNAIVVLSGGMDSTIALNVAVSHYGADNVRAISFFYGQKQREELEMAAASCANLGVKHKVFDLSILGEIGQGFSANVSADIDVPRAEDNPEDKPITYVPNRNMIMFSIAAAYAEVEGMEQIVTGVQLGDNAGYWDCRSDFVETINAALAKNPHHKTTLSAPFVHLSKTDELRLLVELTGSTDALKTSLTCYNPDYAGRSCGVCSSCAGRLEAFANLGLTDPVEYQTT